MQNDPVTGADADRSAPEEPGDSDRIETRLAHAGHAPRDFHGFVNPPVVHASTVLFESTETARTGGQRYTYGRSATPTTDALTDLISEMEGADATVLAPSGLAAVSLSLISCVGAGDRLLVSDSVYAPTRRLCDATLTRFGVQTIYFDPLGHAAFERLLRETSPAAVFLEAPGSVTFDMPDIPALARAAKAAGATVVMDNTWATPLFFAPLAHGVDLSVQAGTKYFGGHSDLLIGSIAGNGAAIGQVAATARNLGNNVGPDDVFLTIRGIRTLPVRLRRHEESGLAVAKWLEAHPAVHRVCHPGLESDPGHEVWKRTFRGASGLFSIMLKDVPGEAVAAFVDGLRLFGIGFSWGGFESLATFQNVEKARTAQPWDPRLKIVRLHVGLEDPADLIADLDQGLARLAQFA